MPTSLKTKMLEAFRLRMYFFLGIVSFVFIIIALQLVNLQLIHGSEYGMKSRMNMENNIPIPAARGELYDRHFQLGKENRIIVSNRPSFNITMIPANFKNPGEIEETLSLLGKVLKIEPADLIKEVKGKNQWERIILKEDVGFDTIVKIATHQDRFPHVDWEDASVRVYNHGNMFAHLVGYIGVISKEEYDKMRGGGYKHYQRIGKSGIEKQYDRLLRGTDGYIRRIVDVRNRTEGEEVASSRSRATT
jgi:penicillin-binding protein 2